MIAQSLSFIENNEIQFKSSDKYLEDIETMNFWPDGRAVFKNNFFVWINGEDHFRFISINTNGILAGRPDKLNDHAQNTILEICPT